MPIFAYTVPAVFIAINATDNPLPQLALGSELSDGSGYLLDKLDKALLFITILYTTAPAVGVLSRMNLITTINGADGSGTSYAAIPTWFKTWENFGLLAWYDHNGDSKVQYAAGNAFAGDGKPVFDGELRGMHRERVTTNPGTGRDGKSNDCI